MKLSNAPIILFVLLGGLSGAAYLFLHYEDIASLQKKAISLTEKKESLELKIKEAEEKIKAKKIKEDLSSIGFSFDEIKDFFPDTYSATQLIQTLTVEAQNADCSVLSSRNSSFQKKAADLNGVSAYIELQATYPQLVQFLSRLTYTNKIIMINRYDIRYSSQTNLLRFSGTFNAFYGKEFFQIVQPQAEVSK